MTSAARLAARLVGAGLVLVFWLLLAATTWLALTPSPPDPVLRMSDIVLHALAFTTLTFLLILAHLHGAGAGDGVPGGAGRQTGRLRGRLHWWAAPLMLAYGVVLELLQSRLPERSAEFKDVWVDLTGIVAGLCLAIWLCGPLRRMLEALLTLLLRRTGLG